jgi:hypothetical protein
MQTKTPKKDNNYKSKLDATNKEIKPIVERVERMKEKRKKSTDMHILLYLVCL